MSGRDDYFFTSESVSEGHPDKVCDRISDAVLDAFLTEHPEARVACETFATTDRVIVGGEVRGPERRARPHRGDRARLRHATSATSRRASTGRRCASTTTSTASPSTSPRASTPPTARRRAPATRGSCSATRSTRPPELMPAPIHYAHAVLRRLAEARKSGAEPRLGPDAKAQLSLRYAGGRPVEVSCLVLSTQHLDESMESSDVREMVEPYIREVMPEGWLTARHGLARQPDRQVRDRRPGRRRRPDRAQDHRRHLRRRRPARRRRLLGQGPDQGRPLGGLCRALPRQERRRGGARQALRAAALLRDRRGAAAVDLRRHLRDRRGRRGRDRAGGRRGDGPDAARHPHPPRAQPADLPAHLGLWPLRPRAPTTRAASPGSGPTSPRRWPRRSDRPQAAWTGRTTRRRRGATSTAGATARS